MQRSDDEQPKQPDEARTDTSSEPDPAPGAASPTPGPGVAPETASPTPDPGVAPGEASARPDPELPSEPAAEAAPATLSYPAPPAGQQPPVRQPYPGYQPPYGYYYPPRPTNGLAIASLVVSCSSVFAGCLFYGIPGLLGAVGAILGHVAQNQIKQSGEQGNGLALAGVIIGWLMTGIAVLAILVIGALIWYAVQHEPTYPDPSPSY